MQLKKTILPLIIAFAIVLSSCTRAVDPTGETGDPDTTGETTTEGNETTDANDTDNTDDPVDTDGTSESEDPGTTDPAGETTAPADDGLFYVRDAWDRPETQTGAFGNYDNAVRQADESGQSVFDSNGELLYDPATTAPITEPTPPAGTVNPSPGDYSLLSNESHPWYYSPGTPAGSDVPASINPTYQSLLDEYDALWQRPVSGRNVVYLTMDEGYEYGTNTTQILDAARERNAPITFFVTGHYIESQPDLIRRMLDEGHQVANHTDQHLAQPEALDTSLETLQADIIDVNTKFIALTGQNLAPYMRPPTGAWSERSLAVSRDLGYVPVFWSFAYRDWETDNQPDPDEAYRTIMDQLYPGSILLIHAVSATNAEIIGRVIDGIRDRGYEIELLPEA